MRVLVKRDSATITPVEVDDERLLELVKEHGGNVVQEDGTPLVLPEAKPKSKKVKDEQE